jgi:2-dehydropantoate 2-reductase
MPDGMMDAGTARRGGLNKVAADIKENVRLLERAGVSALGPKTRAAGKLPKWAVAAIFRIMLGIEFTRGMLLGDHAMAARKEDMQWIERFGRGILQDSFVITAYYFGGRACYAQRPAAAGYGRFARAY